MSKIADIIFRKKREREKREEIERIRRSGIEIESTPEYADNKKIYFILTNALLNFLIVTGCFFSILDAFDVKYSFITLFAVGILISLFMAFLYYFNDFIKIMGYIFSLIVFIYGIYNFRYIIKGGFGHILNKVMKVGESQLNLQLEREYNVYGHKETISVTICMIFIFYATMILLNMAITESKGFVLSFLVTFPFLQLGYYFNRNINLFFMTEYFAGIIALFILRSTNHYRIETKKKHGFLKHKYKNHVTYDYVNDGRYTLNFTVVLLTIISAVTLLFGIGVSQKTFSFNTRFNSMKQSTAEFTQKLFLVGFWGMFGNNGSAGGVGMGKMGDTKFVSLDYETDLKVRTMVNSKQNTIYLKSFNGTFYKDAQWMTISENKDNKIKLSDYNLDLDDVEYLTDKKNKYLDDNLIDGAYIQVTNIDATSKYPYIPNDETYSDNNQSQLSEEDEFKNGLDRGKTVEFIYRPLVDIDSIDKFAVYVKKTNENYYSFKTEFLEKEKLYSEYVHDMYLSVPKVNEKSIDKFCKKYNLTKDTKDIPEKLREIFMDDYKYTLMPGRTPGNEEFVNYFLDKQKKGYCVYFATASTLIFRHLGIPARFTGGYVLFKNEFESGTHYGVDNEQLKKEWTTGSEGDYPYGLGEYELDDSQAHAWTEIYIDGYGWMPFDTTPPSFEDEEPEKDSNGGFGNYLANNIFTAENARAIRNTTIKIFYFMIILVAGFVILIITAGIFIRHRRLNNKNLQKKFDYLCRCTAFTGIVKEENISYHEYGTILIDRGIISEEEEERLIRIYEKYKFSGRKTNQDEIKYFNDTINAISKRVFDKLDIFKKFIYRFIKWL